MAKRKDIPSSSNVRKVRPATSPEAREEQMIALAVDCAEEQLRNGTASSQVITHYLKLAATKEKRKLELETMEHQKELISAKTEAIQSGKKIEELYNEAIKAMRIYSGSAEEGEDV